MKKKSLILPTLQTHGPLSTRRLAELIGASTHYVWLQLEYLMLEGAVQFTPGPRGPNGVPTRQFYVCEAHD